MEIKQACIEAKEAWLNEQYQLIEQLDAAHKTNLMHCQTKEVTGKKRGNGTTTCVEAKDGTIKMEKDKILDRWPEYIGELYDDDRGEMPVKNVYTCFIDYSKAFDTVKHNLLVELLQSLDVDDADTQLLTNLYWTQTAAVRCDKDLSGMDEHQTRSMTGLCSISTLVRIVHRNDNERNRRHGRIPN